MAQKKPNRARKRKRKPQKRGSKSRGRSEAPRPQATACWYRPEVQPRAEAWLARAEEERIEEVMQYHRLALGAGDLPPDLALHATLHVLVENQVAMRDPEETTAAIRRLCDEGMTRHQAIHAIGWLVSRYMDDAARKQMPIDRAGYCRELSGFNIQRWLALATSEAEV